MIEYKDITQLETLDELADGSYIMVVQDGTAKLISSENAKFGGITTFYAVQISAAEPTYTLQHSDGTEVTAQEAYDAYMAGGVRLAIAGDTTFFIDVIAMNWCNSNGKQLDPANVVSVIFAHVTDNGTIAYTKIGQVPSTGK